MLATCRTSKQRRILLKKLVGNKSAIPSSTYLAVQKSETGPILCAFKVFRIILLLGSGLRVSYGWAEFTECMMMRLKKVLRLPNQIYVGSAAVAIGFSTHTFWEVRSEPSHLKIKIIVLTGGTTLRTERHIGVSGLKATIFEFSALIHFSVKKEAYTKLSKLTSRMDFSALLFLHHFFLQPTSNSLHNIQCGNGRNILALEFQITMLRAIFSIW